MAARHATTKLETARALVAEASPPPAAPAAPMSDGEALPFDEAPLAADLPRCPACGARAVVREPLPDRKARAPPEAA